MGMEREAKIQGDNAVGDMDKAITVVVVMEQTTQPPQKRAVAGERNTAAQPKAHSLDGRRFETANRDLNTIAGKIEYLPS